MKKILLGSIFFTIGILGIIFPVLPGVPFLIVSAFFFGFLSREKLIVYLKKLKSNSKKNSIMNKAINYILIKYIHQRVPIRTNGKN